MAPEIGKVLRIHYVGVVAVSCSLGPELYGSGAAGEGESASVGQVANALDAVVVGSIRQAGGEGQVATGVSSSHEVRRYATHAQRQGISNTDVVSVRLGDTLPCLVPRITPEAQVFIQRWLKLLPTKESVGVRPPTT